MKALFVALGVYTGIGGMERFNQRVVRCLSELGLSSSLESRAVVLWDSPEDWCSAPEAVAYFTGAGNKAKTAAAFARQVWDMQPEVILYGHILLAPLAGIARLLSPRSRHVLFVHGREVWLEPFRRRIPLREKLPARALIDRVVAVSRFTIQRMKRAYGLDERVFCLLPNAIDAAPEDNGSASRNGREEIRLLTVTRLGRHDRPKGCDKVIRALPAVLERFPNTHYHLVGDGPLRPELAELAEELKVARNVHFRGYVDDEQLERIYAGADVFVMPSIGEGFGIVFLEAWKHGLPVVAGNRDASAEVVTHGVNGLCVDPHSVAEISAAIQQLIGDTRTAGEMGRNGRRTLLNSHTHAHFRERLLEILQSSLGFPCDRRARHPEPVAGTLDARLPRRARH